MVLDPFVGWSAPPDRRRPDRRNTHPSGGSYPSMIGWPVLLKCLVAWRFGELSQQPTWPQVRHSRRWTQAEPVFRHSSQPSALGVTSRMSAMCLQLFIDSPCDQRGGQLYVAAPHVVDCKGFMVLLQGTIRRKSTGSACCRAKRPWPRHIPLSAIIRDVGFHAPGGTVMATANAPAIVSAAAAMKPI
jgi:hypothetical protein